MMGEKKSEHFKEKSKIHSTRLCVSAIEAKEEGKIDFKNKLTQE